MPIKLDLCLKKQPTKMLNGLKQQSANLKLSRLTKSDQKQSDQSALPKKSAISIKYN